MQILDAQWFSDSLLQKYEIYNYNHALEIMSQSHQKEFEEVKLALSHFAIETSDILAGGGAESAMPRKFASILRPLGWKESRISADLVIHLTHTHEKHSTGEIKTIERYIDGHRIDYLKGRIACDFEWNSKDQTFDRDLYAFRTYYECGIISAAVIVTRSSELETVFRHLGVNAKYGASTTWIGKLLPRLDSRRHGGCPVLVFGITSLAVSTDWKSYKRSHDEKS